MPLPAPPVAIAATATAVLQHAYALARQQQGDGVCLVALHLGAQQCGLAWGSGSRVQTLRLLPLGLQRSAHDYFRTTPPTPLALEHAIEAVEDVVMPLHAQLPAVAVFFSTDAFLHQIAQLALQAQSLTTATATVSSPASPGVLTLAAVEHVFNRLVAVAQGRPAAQEGLPAANAFAAGLLILRECMHHLPCAQITLLGAGLA